MKTKFKVFVTKEISEHPTFEEAFKVFFKEIQALLDRGTTYQVLETMCWIEGIFDGGEHILRSAILFYNARDFAFENGLLVYESGGPSIADPAPVIPLHEVIARFGKAVRDTARSLAEL